MKLRRQIILSCIGLFCCLVWACRPTIQPAEKSAKADPRPGAATVQIRSEIGFRTRRNLEEHYQKHGAEFGEISMGEYLYRAQLLRDSPAGGEILEGVREDGVTTRFDRRTGAFVAYNEDYILRTFFKPNDGERYFNRQLNRR